MGDFLSWVVGQIGGQHQLWPGRVCPVLAWATDRDIAFGIWHKVEKQGCQLGKTLRLITCVFGSFHLSLLFKFIS